MCGGGGRSHVVAMTTSFRREDREWNMVHGHGDLFVMEQGINETVRDCPDAIAGSGKWGSEEILWSAYATLCEAGGEALKERRRYSSISSRMR